MHANNMGLSFCCGCPFLSVALQEDQEDNHHFGEGFLEQHISKRVSKTGPSFFLVMDANRKTFSCLFEASYVQREKNTSGVVC